MSTKAIPSCDCGWTGTPTTPARAAFSLRQHSCDRYRQEQAIIARVAARKAKAGPEQPCHHKQAHHTHGTHACYVLDKCRCRPCKDAATSYERRRAKDRAYGRAAYVDATPAREHIAALRAAGLGWKRIAPAAGLDDSTVWKLIYGDTTRNMAPSKRIRPATAAAILAVPMPTVDDLGATVSVDGTGTRRRLQALVANGWTISELGRQLGMSNIHRTIGRPQVRAETARHVRDLYDRLWNTAPPRNGRAHGGAYTRAKAYAAAHRWAPPLAWDDETIDDPTARPLHQLHTNAENRGIDEAAVLRRMAGDTTVHLTRAERWTVIRRLHADGLNDGQIHARTGIHDRQVLRDRQQLGLPPNAPTPDTHSQKNRSTAA